MPDLGFIHRYVPAREPGHRPLLLLHGTGGDENDLISLGEAIGPGRALLSPRGPVLENGMPRFFRRFAEGVFDEEDIKARAADLARFVIDARAAYGLDRPVAVGFSNGANIAAALLLLHPGALAGAVLMRPMHPLDPPSQPDLAGVPVLMLSGAADPIATPAEADKLAAALVGAGAVLTRETVLASHGLTRDDVDFARGWLAEQP
jgi:phospholipase/carboxylesterase